MSNNKLIIKGNYDGKGSDIIAKIIHEHNIDMNLFYVHSFKVKEGSWNTAAKKRDQELTWTLEDTEKGKTQLMEGYSKHYPEFMMALNKTNVIEVTFMRKPIEYDILESFKDIIKDMPKQRSLPKRKSYNTGIAGEMTTFDAHLAKLAWIQETGYRNYDLRIALKDYKYANDMNIELMSNFKPEIIYYLIGQDMYHMDNMSSHTTGGSHTLDVDGRITKVHPLAFDVTINNIKNCKKIANKVEVIWIPGNHDFLSSYMLAFAVMQYFRGDSSIVVDVSENPRKARLWGTLLVGWTHRIVGKHTVWSNELAQQFPELWGKSKFREWHHGDQHKKQNVKITPIFTSGGVTCRQITALSPVDKWHTDNVFTDAIPGGESFLWSKDKGIFANFHVWTGQYEQNRNQIINNFNTQNHVTE